MKFTWSGLEWKSWYWKE